MLNNRRFLFGDIFGTIFYLVFSFSLILLPNFFLAQAQISGRNDFRICSQSAEIENGSLENKTASDNDSIFVATTDRILLSYNKTTLSLNWLSEIGGDITDLISFDNSLYVVANSSQGKSFLSSINISTGIPLKKLELNIGTVGSFFKVGRNILLTGSDGNILLFDEGLNILWKISDRGFADISMRPVLYGSLIYVAAGSGIFSIDPERGQTKALLDNIVKISALDVSATGSLVAGDKKGKVFTYDLKSGKLSWNYKAGGEILSIKFAEPGLFVNAADNFTYLLSGKGSIKWKRRFKNTAVDPEFYGLHLFLNFPQEKFVIFLNLVDGKIISSIDYPPGESNLQIETLLSLGDRIIAPNLKTDNLVLDVNALDVNALVKGEKRLYLISNGECGKTE